MAQQTSVFTFTGRFGNIIGYRRGKKHFYRSIPETVRQTPATQRAAQRFGVASRKGRLIRSAFSAGLDMRCDGSHVNRLNKALILAGRDNPGGIAGFKFNQYMGTDKFFPITPTFSKDGTLHIPAQQLPQFKGITGLEVKVIASRVDFTARRVTGTDAAVLHIDLQRSFEGADLSVEVPGKGTLIITLQVRCFKDGDASGNRKHQCADIIAVVDEQTQQVYHKPVDPQEEALRQQLAHIFSPERMESIKAIIQLE